MGTGNGFFDHILNRSNRPQNFLAGMGNLSGGRGDIADLLVEFLDESGDVVELIERRLHFLGSGLHVLAAFFHFGDDRLDLDLDIIDQIGDALRGRL